MRILLQDKVHVFTRRPISPLSIPNHLLCSFKVLVCVWVAEGLNWSPSGSGLPALFLDYAPGHWNLFRGRDSDSIHNNLCQIGFDHKIRYPV